MKKCAFSFRITTAVLACALLGSTSSLTGGLIGEFKFIGDLVDSSGAGQMATNMGGAVLTENRFGQSNNAYLFDGTNYIQTTVSGNFTPLSFSVWFRADDLSDERSIVDSDRNGSWGQSLIIGYQHGDAFGDGTLDVQYHDGAYDSGFTPGLGQWHHAVVTFDTNIQLYVDNTLILNQPYTPSLPFNGLDFRFGKHDNGQYFIGAIDDVRFYDHVLSVSEVDGLFNEAAVVPEPNHVALIFASIALGVVFYRRRR